MNIYKEIFVFLSYIKLVTIEIFLARFFRTTIHSNSSFFNLFFSRQEQGT
jgi:hypothetical protein